MRLSIKAMTIACSLFWGGAVMTAVVCNVIWPGYGGAFLDCVGSIYPGFSTKGIFLSIVLDTAYGMADGALAGASLAWLYNLVAAQGR